jgi:exonuclease SbcC
MRLHRLQLQAFGPFAREQIVDFDALGASGLFLLEGPTGAGKTTILDAITFALYGPLSNDPAVDRLHSDFAGPELEPSVELEFSVRGVRYRVQRVPEHERPKKRGPGFTKASARVHLERLEDGQWRSLSSNKGEVGEILGDVLGLNREQFSQVVLLPQGEFAKFLRADNDERASLLTKLFGTQLYDRITNELDQRRAAAAKDVQKAEQTLADCVSASAEAAGLGALERDELRELSATALTVRLSDLEVSLDRDLQDAHGQLVASAAHQLAARTEFEAATALATKTRALIEARDAVARHEAGRVGQTARVARERAANSASPVAPLIAMLTGAETQVSTRRGVVARLLPDASSEISEICADDLVQGAASAEQRAAELTHLVEVEAALPARREAAEIARGEAAQARYEVTALNRRQNELPVLILELEGQIAAARQLQDELAPAVAELKSVDNRRVAAHRLVEIGPVLLGLRNVVTVTVDEYQRLTDVHQQLLESRLDGMAAELAGRLVAGDPCAVCGSPDHPDAARSAAGAVTAADVKRALAARDRAEMERRSAQQEYDTLSQEAQVCSVVAGGSTVGELDQIAAQLRDVIRLSEHAVADSVEQSKRLAQARVESTDLSEQIIAATSRADVAEARYSAAIDEIDVASAGILAVLDEFESVSQLQQSLRRRGADLRVLAAAAQALQAAIAEHDLAQQRAFDAAIENGFADIETARTAALDTSALSALREEIAAWDEVAVRLDAALRAPDLEGLDSDSPDEVISAAHSATIALQEAEVSAQQAHSAHVLAAARVAGYARCLGDVNRADITHSGLVAQSADVNYLSGLARGMSGQRRITLSTYVLRQWFQQVVDAANIRLASMSSGRYELLRTDEGDRARERTGLTLRVADRHTGDDRGTRSLSGGETFYTSLALALGLADVVRAEAGGVDLDTLFIDEGFGSLDADTLDQVMSVIDDLRDRGRVVGIVSHVSELKDRVQERLEVRRISDGSSVVRVVA